MTPEQELHGFVEQLQVAVGLAQLDSRQKTFLRLLSLEGSIPSTAIQPYALIVRTILVMQLLRLAQLGGPRVVASAAGLASALFRAENGGVREAYREAVLPIIAVLQTEHNNTNTATGRCSEPRINAALGQIRCRATLPEALRVDEVARTCHVSKWHLERLLKRYTGLTFKQHVRAVRMSEARQLLLSSDLSIKEIAARVGYLYQTEFARDFKSQFGIAPAAWRRLEFGGPAPVAGQYRWDETG